MTRPLLFLVDHRDPGTIRDWVAHGGRAVAREIAVLTYPEMLRRNALEAAVCVFGDFDRLSPGLLDLVRQAWDRVVASGVRALNDPHRALGRFELLERLSSLGRNDFRAFQVDRVPDDLRFPVFLRRRREHDGPRTPLLQDRASLAAAVRTLTWPRGPHRRGDLLAVEFCDTSNGSGLYTKYGATLVGERLLPRHRMCSSDWSIGGSNTRIDAETVAAEREYLSSFLHRAWVRETFAIAGVEYGRLDYAVCGGRLQAFEINTNPSLGPRPQADPAREAVQRERQMPRTAAHQQHYALLRHAFRALARSGPILRVELGFPARAQRRIRLERARHLLDAALRLGFARIFGRRSSRA